MTKYTVEKIENGIATLRYADNSWAEIVLASDMTQEDLDDKAWDFRPKVGVAPSFVSVGSKAQLVKSLNLLLKLKKYQSICKTGKLLMVM